MTKETETAGAPNAWHTLAVADVLRRVQSDAARGLTRDEAARRLAAHGPNTLPETEHRPLWQVFARQFASPLIYILFAAAVIAVAMGHRGDALVILIVVLFNAVIGTFQEGRVERSMEALRRLSALQMWFFGAGKMNAQPLFSGGSCISWFISTGVFRMKPAPQPAHEWMPPGARMSRHRFANPAIP